jgi:hypothetical protein
VPAAPWAVLLTPWAELFNPPQAEFGDPGLWLGGPSVWALFDLSQSAGSSYVGGHIV